VQSTGVDGLNDNAFMILIDETNVWVMIVSIAIWGRRPQIVMGWPAQHHRRFSSH